MEKLQEFTPDSQSVEDWLEEFEARADCLNIVSNDKKVKWCKSVIGGVGRKILKNLPPGANWNDVKQELRRFLGEEDSRTQAWRKLKQYKAEGKSLGEIASDVLNMANQAAGEDDVRQRLAMEAFLEAIPWKIAREIKKKKIDTVEEGLKEVKLLQMLEEEENKRRGTTFTINKQESPSQEEKGQRKRDVICWGCGGKGHILRNCRKFQAFQKEMHKPEPTSSNNHTQELN